MGSFLLSGLMIATFLAKYGLSESEDRSLASELVGMLGNLFDLPGKDRN